LIALPTRRTRTTTTGQAADLARVAARAADDKKGTDVVVLEVGDVLAITDFFVIASAPNTRQVKTIAEEVEARVKAELGRSPVRSEGLSDLRWVLLDYGDVCVHVFFEETRQFYDLERLWSDVPRLEWTAPRVAASEG
jgi:ribosome-associated protein